MGAAIFGRIVNQCGMTQDSPVNRPEPMHGRQKVKQPQRYGGDPLLVGRRSQRLAAPGLRLEAERSHVSHPEDRVVVHEDSQHCTFPDASRLLNRPADT
jgi:hypothetical protein